MRIAVSWFLSALAAVAAPAQAALPGEVLLVVNADSPSSRLIGRDYEALRGVHDIVQVHCIDSALSRDNETLSRADFDDEILQPVAAALDANPDISFIVLTKGVPIRVDGGDTGEQFGFDRPQVSVDSALAAIGYDRIPEARKVVFDDPDGSAVGTAWLNRYWNADEPFSHARFGGYIVTRLDAFTVDQARALIVRGKVAEAKRQAGTVLLDVQPDFGIDDPSTQPAPGATSPITQESAYSTWNADMVHAARLLRSRGVSVVLDLSPAFARDRTDLLGYFSWGSNDDHFSHRGYESLAFLPGAIGDTAVSTSALTMLPPGSDEQSAIGDLIAHGITGVKGYIEEPLLQGIASPTIALDRYTRGFTLGESLAAASRFVGWTDLVIGDPLVRPYPARSARP